MTVRKIILMCMTCAIVVGCSSHSKTTCSQKTTLKSMSTLGALHMRNCIVRLEAGGRISILALDGDVVALSLSKSEFQRKFPQLYDAYETAIASDRAEDVIIDASLNTPTGHIFE